MKRAFLIVLCCGALISCGSSGDATTIWTKVLKNCAASRFIGDKYLFFGVSNSVGPGSGWKMSNGSLGLLFLPSQPFPSPASVSDFIVSNPTSPCQGDSSTDWDLSAALPFSASSAAISANLAATLRNAKRVQVSISGFSIDLLTETAWLAAFEALPPENIYKAALRQPGAVVAENAVKVTGLKAIFTFDNDLSGDIQAQYKGKTFTLGAPGAGSNSSGADSSSTSSSGGGGSATGGSTASSVGGNASPASDDGCGTSPTAPSSAPSGSTTTSKGGGATLHADVTNARQIVLCGSGPVYLLASYGKVINGTLAASNGTTAAIEPLAIPKGGLKVGAPQMVSQSSQ